MQAKDANTKVVSKLMFRLLPIQILLAAVGSINGIVSSYFASNYIGISAMSVVGLLCRSICCSAHPLLCWPAEPPSCADNILAETNKTGFKTTFR